MIKNYPENPEILKSLSLLLEGNVSKIKYKTGFTNRSVCSDGGTAQVYNTILYRLMEMMVLDVIAGNIVYFDKRKKAMLYIGMVKASEDLIMGKGIKENMDIPLVDFTKTNYCMPYIFLDTGYKRAIPILCTIPRHLYILLIEAVNTGKKYPTSANHNKLQYGN